MSTGPTTFRGVIHGKIVELDQEAGLPDGQQVSVTLEPALLPEDLLKRAFGSWAGGGDELDEFIKGVHRDRKLGRAEPLE